MHGTWMDGWYWYNCIVPCISLCICLTALLDIRDKACSLFNNTSYEGWWLWCRDRRSIWRRLRLLTERRFRRLQCQNILSPSVVGIHAFKPLNVWTVHIVQALSKLNDNEMVHMIEKICYFVAYYAKLCWHCRSGQLYEMTVDFNPSSAVYKNWFSQVPSNNPYS